MWFFLSCITFWLKLCLLFFVYISCFDSCVVVSLMQCSLSPPLSFSCLSRTLSFPAVTMSERWPASTRCQESPPKTTASLLLMNSKSLCTATHPYSTVCFWFLHWFERSKGNSYSWSHSFDACCSCIVQLWHHVNVLHEDRRSLWIHKTILHRPERASGATRILLGFHRETVFQQQLLAKTTGSAALIDSPCWVIHWQLMW